MDNIINFIQTYWGYTLVGGVSVGALITFAVSNIKMLLSNKGKDVTITSITKQVTELKNCLNQSQDENNSLIKNIKALQISQEQKDQYYEKMQSITFKAISYLVMASKLSAEDKEALEADIQVFKTETVSTCKAKLVEYDNALTNAIQTGNIETVKDTVKETVVPDAVQTVSDVSSKIPSLLEKYTNKPSTNNAITTEGVTSEDTATVTTDTQTTNN